MDLKEIQNLIKFVAKSGVSEVQLQTDDFKITIKTPDGNKPETLIQPLAPQAFPSSPSAPIPPPAVPQESPAAIAPKAPEAKPEDPGLVTIKSPMIGTFYRSPGPEKDLFVKVGDEIAKGDTVCIIEAMKLFNEIESDLAGKIFKVLVDDNSPVEYDQPLFLVSPANA